MPVRLFDRKYVEGQLKQRGCHKIKDYSHGSGSLWMTKNGYGFIVPQEPDGHTDENSFRDIIHDIQDK